MSYSLSCRVCNIRQLLTKKCFLRCKEQSKSKSIILGMLAYATFPTLRVSSAQASPVTISLYGDHTAALVSYITKKLSCVYLTDFWGNHFFTDANQTSINLAVLHFASDIRTCSKCTAVTQTVCIGRAPVNLLPLQYGGARWIIKHCTLCDHLDTLNAMSLFRSNFTDSMPPSTPDLAVAINRYQNTQHEAHFLRQRVGGSKKRSVLQFDSCTVYVVQRGEVSSQQRSTLMKQIEQRLADRLARLAVHFLKEISNQGEGRFDYAPSPPSADVLLELIGSSSNKRGSFEY